MKEKVLSLAKGNFIYESPKLVIIPDKLEFTVVAGEKTMGGIVVKNRRGTKIKGFGSTDEPALNFLPVFHAEENELRVEADATELVPGECLKGEIHLVTDCGEAEIPYEIKVVSPELADDKGVVDDYHILRERIRENPQNGAALFHNPNFEANFLYRDEAGKLLYHHLKKHNTKLQGMEEFLVAMGKKEAIRFDVEHPASGQAGDIEIDYELRGTDIQDSLQVRVNTWGSTGIRVRSTKDFIEPEMHGLWTDEFVGNMAVLNFRILADRVTSARKYGSLVLESPYEKKEVRISAHRQGDAMGRKVNRAKKAAVAKLVRTYLAYREGRIEREFYQELLRKNRKVIEKISADYALAVSGYIAVILEDESEVLSFYQKTERLETPLLGTDTGGIENYILIEYMKYLYSGREEDCQRVSKLVEAYWDNGYQGLLLFLLSLQVEERYQVPARKAEAIRGQMKQNPNNIFLYSELLQIYLHEPSALTVLDQDNLATVHYGAKVNLLSEEIALSVSLLAERVSEWNPLVYSVLAELYRIYGLEDTLRSICGFLIRSEKREKRYFPWFAKGVEIHLRMTELYEYYIYTMDYASTVSLPDSVISYFQYENHLGDRFKAFLYAYIVRRREGQPEHFRAYGTHIREFALRQLGMHKASEDIAAIYEGLFQKENIRDSVARELPFVMFTRLLTCHNDRIESVVVAHVEMREEAVYQLEDGRAMIQIYTPNYQLYFVDGEGHYCAGTVPYTLKRLLRMDDFAPLCFEQGSEHVYLLAHLAAKAMRAARLDDMQAAVLQKVAGLGCFREYANGKLLLRLYDYYREKKSTTLLLETLEAIPPEAVKRERLADMAATCIYHGSYRGMYDIAERMLSRYGVEGCDKKALATLVKDRIQGRGGAFVPRLLKWALYLFHGRIYDGDIMKYLLKYYMGNTKTLTAIYRKYQEMSGNAMEDGIKERLLGQVLFSGTNLAGYEGLFLEYYESGNNRVLVKAFLSEYAYEYLVDRLDLTADVFAKIEKEAYYVKDKVMVLAALKRYSRERTFSKKREDFIGRNLEDCANEGLLLTFMRDFVGKIPVPYEIEDAELIQYCSGTDKGIFLHVRGGDGSYGVEPMRKVFDGIYTRELLLFSGEEKTCYVEEEESGYRTEEMTVRREDDHAGAPGFFRMVNQMIQAKENGDAGKYGQLRRQYEIRRAVAAKVFTVH